ncbi:MAG: hypothetical protein Q9M36_08720 [Sulfurovum sp.]|nr:hypothetical protein [Sulfurovum sp.]
MAIILQDKGLENKLMQLSKELHIKTEDLVKQFLKERIEQFTNQKELLNEDLNDINLFEEAKKDKIGIKSIDEMLKEYHIES